MRTSLLLALTLLALTAGIWLGRTLLAPTDSSATGLNVAQPASREILYWVAPMDPAYRRDGPGKSPMGMDLVPVYADEVQAAQQVRIDPTVVANLGIRTASAERGPLARQLRTVGYVSYDEETIQHVHTRVDGWIESLAVTANGDPVRAGQQLFELYAPNLVNAQQDYLALLDGAASPSLVKASRERLRALGMEPAALRRLDQERVVQQRVPFTASGSGYIAHLGVREGIFVTPSTEVLSIARLDTVWVIAEVLERQAGWITAGQKAMVTLDHAPDAPREAVVDYVYPELDPVSRTLRVRLRLPNRDLSLRPNMYAQVMIAGQATPPVVHVPREAVLRDGQGQRVVVAVAPGRYEVRRVRAGLESGQRIGIRRGLAAGELVVVSGQFLLDSEASSSALQRLHSPSTSRQAPPHEHEPAADQDAMDHGSHEAHQHHQHGGGS